MSQLRERLAAAETREARAVAAAAEKELQVAGLTRAAEAAAAALAAEEGARRVASAVAAAEAVAASLPPVTPPRETEGEQRARLERQQTPAW
eukprot:scaffold38421_cov51-Phaeocystis_antarctica.AAC.1